MPQSLKTILAVVLFALPTLSMAQKEGFLKTKDVLYYGLLYGIEENDPLKIEFQFNNGNRRAFSPEEALEYGTADGKRWVTRRFNGSMQFFEELESGKVNLLAQKQGGRQHTYLLEKDGVVIPMGEESGEKDYYKDVISEQLADCYLTEKNIRLAKYTAPNLKYFVSQANECLQKPFPKFRIGPAVGLRLYRNEIKSLYFPKIPEENVALSFGALIEIPLSYKPQLLLVTQPMVAAYSFTVFETNYSIKTDVTAENTHYLIHTDLDLPLMLKYRFPHYKVSPYVQAGPAFQLGLSTESYSITDQYTRVDGQYSLVREDIYTDSGALANKYMGAVAGIGAEIPLSPYITSVFGVNYSIFTSDVDTGNNRKSYPDFFVAVTF